MLSDTTFANGSVPDPWLRQAATISECPKRAVVAFQYRASQKAPE
jgi:hypothetical protein